MEKYLKETECIDFRHPLVQAKKEELQKASIDTLDYIRRAYHFVRDEIVHSWDAKRTVVSKSASEVLANKTGICWTKSCLLAALLRANGIPSGLSYQKLTRADADASDGYIIHALNTVYVEELSRWLRMDARGNKETVHAQFDTEKEILAFPVRPELKEIDYHDNHADLDERLVRILKDSENVLMIRADIDISE